MRSLSLKTFHRLYNGDRIICLDEDMSIIVFEVTVGQEQFEGIANICALELIINDYEFRSFKSVLLSALSS